jgi:hypothetical protein
MGRLAASCAFALLAISAAHSQDSEDTCKDISAIYSENERAVVVLGKDGKTLNILMARGKRPNAYGTCVAGKVWVDFTDDRGCCTATFDGKSIKWDNGTVWSKLP